MPKLIGRAIVAPAVFLLCGAQGAHAQQTAAAQAAPRVEAGDIIVTAQRRDERLADIPISITAIGAPALTAAGVTSTGALTRVTPGLVAVDQGFNFVAAIRGISSSGNTAGDESNVALYVDGVYVSTATAGLFSFNNIERVEVLKGPQGTLFGRNATGGAIRVITRTPTQRTTLDASAEYLPIYNGKRAQFYLSGGLAANVAADIAAYYYDDDGFIRNINPTWAHGKIGRSRTLSFRSKILWSAGDTIDFTLAADHSNSRTSANLSPRSDYLALAPLIGFSSTGPFETSRTFEPRNSVNSSGVSLTTAWRVAPALRLNAITAYNHVDSNNLLDADNTYLDISSLTAEYRTNTFSQELTLASSFNGIVNFTAGAFYYSSNACGCGISVFRTPLAAPVSLTTQHVDTRSTAEFGELTLNPAPSLQFIGGVRFTQEKKTSSGFAVAPVAFTASDRDKSHNTSVRATARYTLNDDDANIYFTYSTGFKSSAYGTISVIPQKARPEKIAAYEIGVKIPLFDRRLLVTAAAFHYNYTDIQLSTLNLQTAVVALQNAGRAKVDGAEVGLSGRIGQHLSLNSGLSWLPTAKYTRFPGAAITRPNPAGPGLVNVITDLSGTRLLRAPRFTVNLGGSYTADVAGGTATFSANAYHTSRVYFLADERVGQKPYETLDLRLAFSPHRGPLELYVYGTNVTDRYYATGAASSTAGDSYYSGRPREIGLGARVRL